MPEPNVSIESALDAAAKRLSAVSDSARLDAELLLARAIDMPRSFLFAHQDDLLDAASLERFESTVSRRLAGVPLAYITGEKEFWSMRLMVTPATLVPRPESELMVELALRELPRRSDAAVLDLGTGSGAVALAIARERPNCRVTATDLSADAIAVARENARQLALPNVEFLAGDWGEPVRGRRFRVVVSNPPYVARGDEELEALKAEPELALVGGDDGLEAIRRLAAECGALLDDDGMLLFEHGSKQAGVVARLLSDHGWRSIECHRDPAGLPRVTAARMR